MKQQRPFNKKYHSLFGPRKINNGYVRSTFCHVEKLTNSWNIRWSRQQGRKKFLLAGAGPGLKRYYAQRASQEKTGSTKRLSKDPVRSGRKKGQSSQKELCFPDYLNDICKKKYRDSGVREELSLRPSTELRFAWLPSLIKASIDGHTLSPYIYYIVYCNFNIHKNYECN